MPAGHRERQGRDVLEELLVPCDPWGPLHVAEPRIAPKSPASHPRAWRCLSVWPCSLGVLSLVRVGDTKMTRGDKYVELLCGLGKASMVR